MKNKGLIITLITILIIIGISLTILTAKLINGNFKFKMFTKISDELILDETYEEYFSKVEINTDMSNIHVMESNDNKFKVVIYGDKDRTNVDTSNNKLDIETTTKKCFGICFNQMSAKVEVYIPADFDKELIIKNKYGDIEIGNLSNAKVDVTADCGDIDIDSVNYTNIKNSYGNIKLNRANTATIDESCGDIEIGEVESIVVQNNYGDINIDEVEEYIEAIESCGNIKIGSLNLIKNSSIKNNLGDIKIDSTSEIYIDASVDLGDIKINNNYRESSIVLKIENDCGDIKINN